MKRNTTFNNHWFCSILFCFLFLISSPILAQDKIRVHAVGFSISRDKTPKEAQIEALEDAKKNAFEIAGISENLVVSNLLHTSGKKQTIETYFHGISNTELGANILVDSIYAQRNNFDQYGNMLIEVEIEALIYRYEKPKDPSFFFDISKLKDVYYENEFIRFFFTPSQNGYLTIFVFNENESLMLYPYDNQTYEYLSDEKEKLFVKEKQVSFPINNVYDPGYSIELMDPHLDEASLLLFVYTKKYIPWIKEQISLEAVRSWIYDIPIDQRDILYRNVLLKQLD